MTINPPYNATRLAALVRHSKHQLLTLILCFTCLTLWQPELHAAAVSTKTFLSSSARTVPASTPATFTAKVSETGQWLTAGTVQFCDSRLSLCEGAGFLGSAQITKDGTATFTKVLGAGGHHLYALFKGTASFASSQSSPVAVSVDGKQPSSAITISRYTGIQYGAQSKLTTTGPTIPTGNIDLILDSTGATVASTKAWTFQPPLKVSDPIVSSVPSTFTDSSPLFGDLNRDGVADIITSTKDGITVFLGDPAHPGSFQYATSYPQAELLGLADLNNDGYLDLITIVTGSTYTQTKLQIDFGDPLNPGSLKPGMEYEIPWGDHLAAVGDFNGDGYLDLAISIYSNNDQVIVYWNDPTHPGQFPTPTSYPNLSDARGIQAGDFNHDGLDDLATVSGTDNDLRISLADAAHPGQFLPVSTYPLPATPNGLTVGDLNGDGYLDLMSTDYSYGYPWDVQLYINNSANPGQFQTSDVLNYPIPTLFAHPYLGDIDGDGFVDIIYLDNASTVYFQYHGDPTSHDAQFSALQSADLPQAASWYAASISPYTIPDFVGLSDGKIITGLGQIQSTVWAIDTANVSAQDTFVHAHYEGDEVYHGSNSCTIDLTATAETAPVISGANLSSVTANSATISWTTNVPSNGYVQYGNTTSLGQMTPWINQVSTQHSFTLSNLTPGTTYYYRIGAASYFDNCDHKSSYTAITSFTTKAQ